MSGAQRCAREWCLPSDPCFDCARDAEEAPLSIGARDALVKLAAAAVHGGAVAHRFNDAGQLVEIASVDDDDDDDEISDEQHEANLDALAKAMGVTRGRLQ